MNALARATDLIDPPVEPLTEEGERVAADLKTFVRGAWAVLEPATPYLHNWHIDLIAEYLEAVYAREITRLIVNIPPRYMKSSLITILGPVWDWVHRPSDRFLFASYAQLLSTKHSVDRRTLIRSDWFQDRFGDRFRLAGDQDVKTEFSNTKRGHMIATSMTGSGTGKGGDHIVIDDPQDPKRAASDQQRETINTLFDQVFSQRLDDKRRGTITVVMQRLHESDLTGHLLEKGGWEHLKVPAEAKRSTVIDFPRSKRTKKRDKGDVLWPEREGPAELKAAQIALGSYGYAGQYDQDPSPAEGGIFRRQWWGYWKPPGTEFPAVPVTMPDGDILMIAAIDLPSLDTVIQSWDCAFKDTKSSSYVVGQVWGTTGALRFLLDQTRDRMSFTRTVAEVVALSSMYPESTTKLVEDKANGPAVLDVLRNEVSGIMAEPVEGGKVARAHAVSPQVEAGQVFLPHPGLAPWVGAFIEEHAVFPNGTNDDQVDAMSQALRRLANITTIDEDTAHAITSASFHG